MSEETLEPTPQEEPAETPQAEAVEVNLESEAQGAVDTKPSYEFSSLDDISDPSLRSAVQKYTSRAVNQAKGKWEESIPKQPEQVATPTEANSNTVSREELQRMLESRDRENQLRYEAGKRLRGVFESSGIEPDSDRHKQVVSFYQSEKDAGRLAPEVLLSEAGIRSIIHASGALLPDAEGPQGGKSSRVADHVESTILDGGDIQLGNSGGEDPNSPSAKARAAMREALGGS